MSDETKILSESMKIRNTDTSALKRIPTGNTPSESSAARKTIKLKPLAPRSGNNPSTSTTTASLPNIPAMKPLNAVSSPVSAPTIMMNEKQKLEDQETHVPQFMSTATAPVSQIAKPAAAPAESAVKTSSAPAINTIHLKNALGAVATASKISSPGATPTSAVPKISIPKASSIGATGTVSMPRLNKRPTPAAPPPSQSAVPQDTITLTGVAPKVEPNDVKATVQPTATANIPKMTVPIASAPTVADPIQNASTEKLSLEDGKLQSGLGASKPAIKLRPSGNFSGPVPVAAPSAQTIKLTHKLDSAVAPMPSASAGVPTIQLSKTSAPASDSPQTLVLPPNPTTETLTPDVNPLSPASAANADNVTVTTKIPRKVGFKKPS